MRLDFELGAFKFMYIDSNGDDASRALNLFKEMTDQISKVLPAEIVQALVAADPAVVEAMKAATIRDFSQRFEESVVKPISQELKNLDQEPSGLLDLGSSELPDDPLFDEPDDDEDYEEDDVERYARPSGWGRSRWAEDEEEPTWPDQ